MSASYLGFVASEDGPGVEAQIASTQPLDLRPGRRPAPLSHSEWGQLRESIMDLFENQGWTVKQLDCWMRNKGYKTTPKMISGRLKSWGCGKYQSDKEKERICRQLYDVREAGRDIEPLEMRQIKKLQRYCREKRTRTSQDTAVLDMLSKMEITIMVSTTENSTKASEATKPTELAVTDTGSTDSDDDDTEDDKDGFVTGCSTGTPITDVSSPTPHFPACTRSLHRDRAETVLRLSHELYMATLHEYSSSLQEESLAGARVASLDALVINRQFWTTVKNGIYWLKTRSDHLAWPELHGALRSVSQLCESLPFPLLRDMYATLSPAATRVNPGVRTRLLQAFHHHAMAKARDTGNRNAALFGQICHRLGAEESSDELSAMALQAMLDAARPILPARHPDLVELQRTLVRLHRRNGDLGRAEALALEFARAAEALFGPGHVNTRLALSEHVYVLSAQGRYVESLALAKEVLRRAREELGESFPDDRSVYAMEDVADICARTGQLSDAVFFLRQALRAAMRVRGDCSSTTHIMDKLEAMEDERYRGMQGLAPVPC